MYLVFCDSQKVVRVRYIKTFFCRALSADRNRLAQRVGAVYFRRSPSERKPAKVRNAWSIVNLVGSVVFFCF